MRLAAPEGEMAAPAIAAIAAKPTFPIPFGL
jgi:hypothetical protein